MSRSDFFILSDGETLIIVNGEQRLMVPSVIFKAFALDVSYPEIDVSTTGPMEVCLNLDIVGGGEPTVLDKADCGFKFSKEMTILELFKSISKKLKERENDE